MRIDFSQFTNVCQPEQRSGSTKRFDVVNRGGNLSKSYSVNAKENRILHLDSNEKKFRTAKKMRTGDFMEIFLDQKTKLGDRKNEKSIDFLTNKRPANSNKGRIDGVYEGDVDVNYRKQGLGAFIEDSGEMYIGEWENDLMHGEGILMFPFGGQLYARFRMNQVQGEGVIYLPSKKLLVGYWSESRLHGSAFELNLKNRMWSKVEYKQGQRQKIIATEQVEILSSGRPNMLRGHKELYIWMDKFMKKNYLKNIYKISSRYISRVIIDEEMDYIGFIEENNCLVGLGCATIQNRMISGNFKNGVLEGQGHMVLENGDIYDGQFASGMFNGKGMYYNCKQDSYTIGVFANNSVVNCISQGNSYPSCIICNWKIKKIYFSLTLTFRKFSQRRTLQSQNVLQQAQLVQLRDNQEKDVENTKQHQQVIKLADQNTQMLEEMCVEDISLKNVVQISRGQQLSPEDIKLEQMLSGTFHQYNSPDSSLQNDLENGPSSFSFAVSSVLPRQQTRISQIDSSIVQMQKNKQETQILPISLLIDRENIVKNDELDSIQNQPYIVQELTRVSSQKSQIDFRNLLNNQKSKAEVIGSSKTLNSEKIEVRQEIQQIGVVQERNSSQKSQDEDKCFQKRKETSSPLNIQRFLQLPHPSQSKPQRRGINPLALNRLIISKPADLYGDYTKTKLQNNPENDIKVDFNPFILNNKVQEISLEETQVNPFHLAKSKVNKYQEVQFQRDVKIANKLEIEIFRDPKLENRTIKSPLSTNQFKKSNYLESQNQQILNESKIKGTQAGVQVKFEAQSEKEVSQMVSPPLPTTSLGFENANSNWAFNPESEFFQRIQLNISPSKHRCLDLERNIDKENYLVPIISLTNSQFQIEGEAKEKLRSILFQNNEKQERIKQIHIDRNLQAKQSNVQNIENQASIREQFYGMKFIDNPSLNVSPKFMNKEVPKTGIEEQQRRNQNTKIQPTKKNEELGQIKSEAADAARSIIQTQVRLIQRGIFGQFSDNSKRYDTNRSFEAITMNQLSENDNHKQKRRIFEEQSSKKSKIISNEYQEIIYQEERRKRTNTTYQKDIANKCLQKSCSDVDQKNSKQTQSWIEGRDTLDESETIEQDSIRKSNNTQSIQASKLWVNNIKTNTTALDLDQRKGFQITNEEFRNESDRSSRISKDSLYYQKEERRLIQELQKTKYNFNLTKSIQTLPKIVIHSEIYENQQHQINQQ